MHNQILRQKTLQERKIDKFIKKKGGLKRKLIFGKLLMHYPKVSTKKEKRFFLLLYIFGRF